MKVTAPRHLSTEWGIHYSYYIYVGGRELAKANWQLSLIGDLHIVRLTAPSLIYDIP